MNTRMTFLLALGLGASIASSATLTGPGQNSNTRSGQVRMVRQQNADPTNLNSAMRKLWEDHVTWTRLYIVSAANDLPNTEATKTRLLQNQVDIGNAIRPIYGETSGDRLSSLLRDHILISAGVVTAAKTHDSDGLAYQKERWYDNGTQIADLLSSANPNNWNQSEMRSMMREHLDLTLDEAVAELNGDYRTSIRRYDQVRTQILKMADMLSEGISTQFPDKFTSNTYSSQLYPAAYTAMRVDSGTVIPFSLNQRLSSNESSVGDRFTANLDTGDNYGYQGLANGAILEGHVDVARAKSGNTPGVLGLAFDRIRMPDGRTYPVYGALSGLDSKSVDNRDGRLVAKAGAKNNLKYVGYGAAGGALLAVLTKGNVVTDTLLGGALGYLFGEIKKDPSKANNVTANVGTKFGVRLTRDLSFRSASSGNR